MIINVDLIIISICNLINFFDLVSKFIKTESFRLLSLFLSVVVILKIELYCLIKFFASPRFHSIFRFPLLDIEKKMDGLSSPANRLR